MKALVLAAGRGKRLNNFTKGQNKCLVKVNGKSVIQYTVDTLTKTPQITECIIVVGYKAEEVMECVGNVVNGVKIRYCRQLEQKGLINAMESAVDALAGDDFIMILGDEFITNHTFEQRIQEFYESGHMAKIGIIKAPDIELVKKTYTFHLDENFEMKDFVEKPENPYSNYMGTGNIIFKGYVCGLLKEVPVNPIRGERELVDLFNIIVEKGEKLSGYIVGDAYINLNTEHDVMLLTEMLGKPSVESI